jgi:hypothetical protein
MHLAEIDFLWQFIEGARRAWVEIGRKTSRCTDRTKVVPRRQLFNKPLLWMRACKDFRHKAVVGLANQASFILK